jgi:(E)-4-hydroxy-3-methylbut-2-enyl-diphosphate synthase
VTEAGLGEDGRIKSAVGIGALLDDGLGDTVRVSLTEEPEAEVPVAQRLVEPYNSGLRTARAYPEQTERIDPYSYTRRLTTPITISGRPTPSSTTVLSATVHGEPLNPRETRSGPVDAGLSLPVHAERLNPRESQSPTGVSDLYSLVVGGGATVAVLDPPEEALTSSGSANGTAGVSGEDIDLSALARLEQRVPWYDAVRAYRHLATTAGDKPIHLQVTVDGDELEVLLRTATVMGSLLCDGLGDSVGLTAPGTDEDLSRLLFGILQAAGVRITKTEFVSCPSCGRTLFDLQTTTERIAARTSHLKGVKIAIMGCVVNGPGEMADADFGYVGGSPGHVNLYVGKEVVEKAVPEGHADERLVDLIRRHGKWQEPAEQV